MAFALLLLSFIFGRVALQVSVGKQIQKRFLPENKHSETLALLIGAFVWTALLSIPYLWTFALIVLTAASLGLVLTARSTNGWQKT
jgi:RsiW-degrading membrane proteinase PrsW (M82 family)